MHRFPYFLINKFTTYITKIFHYLYVIPQMLKRIYAITMYPLSLYTNNSSLIAYACQVNITYLTHGPPFSSYTHNHVAPLLPQIIKITIYTMFLPTLISLNGLTFVFLKKKNLNGLDQKNEVIVSRPKCITFGISSQK